MLIPSKEEFVSRNLLVQGSRVIAIIKDGALTFDDIQAKFPTKRYPYHPSVERLMDIVTLLYTVGFVEVSGGYVSLKAKKS